MRWDEMVGVEEGMGSGGSDFLFCSYFLSSFLLFQ